MCSPVRCRTCGKTTWAGCGQHVAQVKARVAPQDWCPGHARSAAPTQDAPSWLRRILGR